jgi:DNA invertase Pin-like site-specific DNA recombinase
VNDANRRKFDVVMFWAIDRLGRSLIGSRPRPGSYAAISDGQVPNL